MSDFYTCSYCDDDAVAFYPFVGIAVCDHHNRVYLSLVKGCDPEQLRQMMEQADLISMVEESSELRQ